jgi:predicted homoserine dehydrogenase-like protein
MAKTVDQTLRGADDSVTLINQINSGDFSHFMEGYTQAVINRRVTDNVEYIESVLAYEEVEADNRDKSSYTTAIATGKQYITDNT